MNRVVKRVRRDRASGPLLGRDFADVQLEHVYGRKRPVCASRPHPWTAVIRRIRHLATALEIAVQEGLEALEAAPSVCLEPYGDGGRGHPRRAVGPQIGAWGRQDAI